MVQQLFTVSSWSLPESGGPFIDQVYVLQSYAEGWKEGTWEEKVDDRPCIDPLLYSQDKHEYYRYDWQAFHGLVAGSGYPQHLESTCDHDHTSHLPAAACPEGKAFHPPSWCSQPPCPLFTDASGHLKILETRLPFPTLFIAFEPGPGNSRLVTPVLRCRQTTSLWKGCHLSSFNNLRDTEAVQRSIALGTVTTTARVLKRDVSFPPGLPLLSRHCTVLIPERASVVSSSR